MENSGQERLAPPPFWRTRYFENSVRLRPDRRNIDPAMILTVLAHPERQLHQPGGRIVCWGWVPALNHWLRVVTLEDGETVHTAFLDRDFRP